MGLEAATLIHELDPSNPVGGSDPKSQGDDHIRMFKGAVQNTFPNVEGVVTSSHTELNILDGVTATAAELNTLDGVTASAAELNQLDNVTLRDAVTLRTAFCRTGGNPGGGNIVDATRANRNVSCTRSGTGVYVLDYTAAGFTTPPNIQIFMQNNALFRTGGIITSTATTTTVQTFNFSSVASDALFDFLAVGT